MRVTVLSCFTWRADDAATVDELLAGSAQRQVSTTLDLLNDRERR